MELSEEQVKVMIQRAIELFEYEKNKKKQVNLLLSGPADQRLERFFREQEQYGSYEWNAVVTKEQMEDKELCVLLTKYCKSIARIDQAIALDTMKELTIIPIVSLELLVKTALCIPDIEQVQWIHTVFQKGSRIQINLSGLPSLTGKEPEGYKQKILSYIRMIMEYGIEIKQMEGEVER